MSIPVNDKTKLESINLSNAPGLYSLNGKIRWCKVIDIYDGDTVNIIFLENNEIQHHKFRLYGIDTPEIKPLKKLENRQEIIDLAQKSKEFLKNLILDKIVFVKFHKEEKYGRLMGEMYVDPNGKSVNQLMIESGHAKEYFGGKK
jgi:endonuclease YncB( thermonuclease family)